MKRILFSISALISTLSFSQDCSELFISEYAEGWSNNKAIEIYNPTSSTVDLSEYILVRYSNGSTSAGADKAIQLIGSLAPYDVHVAVLDKNDPSGQGQDAPVWDSLAIRADEFYCPDYNATSTMYFNGNDAMLLAKGSVSDVNGAQIVDIFGRIGENPGNGSDPETGWTSETPFTGAGDGVTVDHSLIRKPNISVGNSDAQANFTNLFDPLEQWDSIPAVVDINGTLYGNWFSLGSHTCDCANVSVDEVLADDVSVYPNPSTGVVLLKGISAFNNVEVLNALGQLVYQNVNTSGNVIKLDLSANKGVYFVKLIDESGNIVTKKLIVK